MKIRERINNIIREKNSDNNLLIYKGNNDDKIKWEEYILKCKVSAIKYRRNL